MLRRLRRDCPERTDAPCPNDIRPLGTFVLNGSYVDMKRKIVGYHIDADSD